jgi:hypothetical protein
LQKERDYSLSKPLSKRRMVSLGLLSQNVKYIAPWRERRGFISPKFFGVFIFRETPSLASKFIFYANILIVPFVQKGLTGQETWEIQGELFLSSNSEFQQLHLFTLKFIFRDNFFFFSEFYPFLFPSLGSFTGLAHC